jgi:DNA-directed RNA polymerase sigma subunit (sigma70/sigma32)
VNQTIDLGPSSAEIEAYAHWANEKTPGRCAEILRARLSGRTLSAIGQDWKLSAEQVRSIEAKGLRKIIVGRLRRPLN